MDPSTRPFKQKKRTFALKRNMVAAKEVDKLIKANR